MYQIQRNGSLIRMELLLKQQSESLITENKLLKQNQIMIKKIVEHSKFLIEQNNQLVEDNNELNEFINKYIK